MPDRPRRPGNEGGSQGGFVLVAVLSVLAFLAFMFAATTLLSRQSVETAVLETDSVRDDSMLASGIQLAGHQLFVLRVDPASVNGQQVRLDDGTITIHVSSEAGKVDLNGADEVLLAAAYRAAGLTALAPEAFAARVLDWRDDDDITSPDGAESGEYGAAGLGYAPADAPFRAIGDLRWVLGVGAADVAALAPFLTVSNPAGKIDPTSAAPRLLMALPNLDPGAAAALGDILGRKGIDRLFAIRSIFRGLERHIVLGESLRAFNVRVEARRNDEPRPQTASAVLIAPVVSGRPFQITQWKRDGRGRS